MKIKEALTPYKFSSFELELVGFLTRYLNKISLQEFNLCPIYSSILDLTLSDSIPNDFSEKPSDDINMIDPLGFYSQNDSRKVKTIVISTGKIDLQYNGVKNKRIKTIVLIHEIGHFISYNLPLFNQKKSIIQNHKNFCKDTDFQELWAQAFAFKFFQSFVLEGNGSFCSEKSNFEAFKCMHEMNILADFQPTKYKTYKSLFGESDSSFTGKSYEKVSLEHLFYWLKRAREENLFSGEYSDFFKKNCFDNAFNY